MSTRAALRPLAMLTIGVALIAAACAGSEPEPPSTSTSSRSPGASPAGPDLRAVKLTLSKLNGLVGPIALAVRPGDDALYVAEKTGRVRRVAHGQTTTKAAADATPVLDLSGEVSTGSEQGLLGLTFSPERYNQNLWIDHLIEGADRGRDRPCGRPPAQIPACGTTALGSCLRYERRIARRDADAGCGRVEATESQCDSFGSSPGCGAGCGAGAPSTSAG